MSSPLAYFLTWTTYGTHLRGHEAGSVDHTRDGHGNADIPPSSALRNRDFRRLVHSPVVLSKDARECVTEALIEHCDFKSWKILALEVRSNHVHVLICANVTPESLMTSCKRWATRALRDAGLLAKEAKAWTSHGSTRWINDEASLQKAYQYITEFQEGPKATKRYESKDNPN